MLSFSDVFFVCLGVYHLPDILTHQPIIPIQFKHIYHIYRTRIPHRSKKWNRIEQAENAMELRGRGEVGKGIQEIFVGDEVL